MNISKRAQRALHTLAQGGLITLERGDHGELVGASCVTRDGWALGDFDLALFRSLKRKRLIASHAGLPYRITRDGLANLRAQLDNRTRARGW